MLLDTLELVVEFELLTELFDEEELEEVVDAELDTGTITTLEELDFELEFTDTRLFELETELTILVDELD